LMPDAGHSALVATAIISIALNPLLLRLVNPLEGAVRQRPWLWRLLNGRAERRLQVRNAAAARVLREGAGTGPTRYPTAIVVGYGFVGRSVCRLLRKAGIRTVILDMNMDVITELNERGDEMQVAFFGDARSPAILEQCGIREAKYLLITPAKSASPVQVTMAARELNPELRIFARSRYVGEMDLLLRAGATQIASEEAEIAVVMGGMVLRELGHSEELVAEDRAEIRRAAASLPGGSVADSDESGRG